MTETVFLLIGIEYFGEENGYTDVLGIYCNLEHTLDDIKHYEQDKKNYSCFKCDLEVLDDLPESQF